MEHESHGYVRPINRYSALNVNRQLTNKIVGIIFIISFLLWLVAVIYGVAIPIEGSSGNTSLDIFDTERTFIAIGFVLLSAVVTLIVFTALRWIPCITNLVLWTFWLPVPIFVAAAAYQPTFWSIHTAVGSILGCLFILILLKSEWFHLSEAVLKEACKMIFSVPSTFLFIMLAYLLSVFAVGITIAAIVKLVWNGTTFFTILLVIMNYFFGAWTVITIAALSWMTVSGTFSEYYYAENKGSVSFGTLLKLFTANCRYHVGTAAMFNPLLGGIRALYYVAALGVCLIIHGASKSTICFVIYNIFDPIVLRMVFLGGAATCGIKGENFYNSMAHTMTLFSDNPRSFLIVVKVMELLMGLSSGLVMFVTSFSTIGYVSGSGFKDAQTSLFVIIVLLGALAFVGALATCVTAAAYSILLCLYDEISVSGNAASIDSSIMSPNLQAALNHDGAPSWFRNSCGSCLPDFEYNANQ